MLHRDLTKEKWQTYSLSFQMGSIGAEVARFLNFLKKGDRAGAEKAMGRVLELLHLTIESSKPSKELLRLEEIVKSKFYKPESYDVTDEELNNYFLPFAIRARNK